MLLCEPLDGAGKRLSRPWTLAISALPSYQRWAKASRGATGRGMGGTDRSLRRS
jgi:hypothetical protein